MTRDLWPARETMGTRDDKLRRRQRALAAGELLARKLLDAPGASIDPIRRWQGLGTLLERSQPFNPGARQARMAVASLDLHALTRSFASFR